MDKISIFYPLHVSVMNITDNIRLFQKSYGVSLAYGGNMWQHVGSFWTVGDIEGVFFISSNNQDFNYCGDICIVKVVMLFVCVII